MSLHENTGSCRWCARIISRYPGFYSNLLSWFIDMQSRHHEMHVSCAGRGHMDQEAAKMRGASRAGWLQSAHNYNAALDLFVNRKDDLYPSEWFKSVLEPALPNWVAWYGKPGSSYFELPHVEVRGWAELAKQGIIFPVERSSPSLAGR